MASILDEYAKRAANDRANMTDIFNGGNVAGYGPQNLTGALLNQILDMGIGRINAGYTKNDLSGFENTYVNPLLNNPNLTQDMRDKLLEYQVAKQSKYGGDLDAGLLAQLTARAGAGWNADNINAVGSGLGNLASQYSENPGYVKALEAFRGAFGNGISNAPQTVWGGLASPWAALESIGSPHAGTFNLPANYASLNAKGANFMDTLGETLQNLKQQYNPATAVDRASQGWAALLKQGLTNIAGAVTPGSPGIVVPAPKPQPGSSDEGQLMYAAEQKKLSNMRGGTTARVKYLNDNNASLVLKYGKKSVQNLYTLAHK